MVVWYCVVLCGAGGRGSKKARTPALTSSVLPRHPNTIEGGEGVIVFQRWGSDVDPALVRYCVVVRDGVFAGGARRSPFL